MLVSSNFHFYLGSDFVKLQVLKSHTDLVTSGLVSEELEKLHISIIDSNPSLQNSGTTDSSASNGFPKDVEDEANNIFQDMFHDKIPVPNVVQRLIRFKESSVKR
jgi:CCR4-NOT transcription complex subunit 1